MDKEAKLLYGGSEFQIVQAGSYVCCARSGERIPLSRLLYWNVERQEPYASPQLALEAEEDARAKKNEAQESAREKPR